MLFVLESIKRIQDQKGNGNSVNVKDGSMKTVLIMVTPMQVMHSVHFLEFSHTTFHTSISFVVCLKVFMKFYW